jgi:DNA-directed RNA polymerase specialized sigma24 family protein
MIECEASIRGFVLVSPSDVAGFTRFVDELAQPLKQALMASFGPEIGDEATAEALAYGWEHWNRIKEMTNPRGYLYRVAHNYAKRTLTRRFQFSGAAASSSFDPWFEPDLAPALRRLSGKQRAAVVLIHGFGWRVTEVAELWGVTFSTVQAHLDRGMNKLRKRLGVDYA